MGAVDELKALGFTTVDVVLTQHKWTTIDIDDAQSVLMHRWHAKRAVNTGNWYASRNPRIPGTKEKRLEIPLHRSITNVMPGQVVDHGDRNGLNNRQYNLRPCSYCDNNTHKIITKPSKTGFRGVSLNPASRTRPFRADIRVRGKYMYLGHYRTAEDAAFVYDEVAESLNGEFAVTNAMMGRLPKE